MPEPFSRDHGFRVQVSQQELGWEGFSRAVKASKHCLELNPARKSSKRVWGFGLFVVCHFRRWSCGRNPGYSGYSVAKGLFVIEGCIDAVGMLESTQEWLIFSFWIPALALKCYTQSPRTHLNRTKPWTLNTPKPLVSRAHVHNFLKPFTRLRR